MKKTSMLICLTFVSGLAKTQNQFTNTGNIQLHAGTNITFFGDFSNNGTFTDEGQMVNFSGTSNQNVTGTSSTTLSNLTINNNSGVTLQQNVNITSSIILTNGSLQLNSNTLTINNNSSTAVSRTNGYIVSEQTNNTSKVGWNIASSTGSHIFPFGSSGGIYIPFTVDLVSGNIGKVTVATYPTATNNIPLPVSPVTVTNLNNEFGIDNSASTVDRFWQIDKDGISGTANLTFTTTNVESVGISSLVAQRWNASTSSWDLPLPGQTGSATSVTVPGVTGFSPWTLSGNFSPLPIELISFNAIANENNEVDLLWVTASETNNDYFTIEKTIDGIVFETVALVNGAGSTNISISYSSVDENPYAGVSYYRLKQTDFDGTSNYSNLIPVTIISSGLSELTVFPNPSNDLVNIIVGHSFDEPIEVSLIDQSGKKIHSTQGFIKEGQFKMVVDKSSFIERGIYFVRITGQHILINKKVVIL